MAGRFFRRNISKVDALPAVAILAAPTTVEIAAGVSIDPEIAEMTGFEFANSPISTPDLSTIFTKTIGGEDVAKEPTLVLYDRDDTTNDIRDALVKDTELFMLLSPYGKTAGKRVETWPMKVVSQSDKWSVGNEAAFVTVMFSVTDVPEQQGVYPS